MEGPYGFTGNTFSMASGRIAYSLGVHGPAVTIDSACSSSLLAVHMACRSLNDGESDLALAGGALVMLEPRKFAAGWVRHRAICLPRDAVPGRAAAGHRMAATRIARGGVRRRKLAVDQHHRDR